MNSQPHSHELQVWRGTETTCVTYGDQSRYLHRIHPWLYRWLLLAVPHPLPIDVRIRRAALRLRRRHDRSFRPPHRPEIRPESGLAELAQSLPQCSVARLRVAHHVAEVDVAEDLGDEAGMHAALGEVGGTGMAQGIGAALLRR